MSYFFVGDEFYDDPKLAELPEELELACVGLWTKAGSWSRKKLTGGHVPRSQVRKFGATIEMAEALCAARLWEPAEGGYAFRNWEEWQETAEERQSKRDRWKRRKAAWRDKQRAKGDPGDDDPPPPPRPSGAPGDMSSVSTGDKSGVSTGDTADKGGDKSNGVHQGQSAADGGRPQGVQGSVRESPSPSPSPSPNPSSAPTHTSARAGARSASGDRSSGSTVDLPEARERVRAGLPLDPSYDDLVGFSGAVGLFFRRLCRDAGKSDPSLGGKLVGAFPERLANTSRDRGVNPADLMEGAFKAWVKSEFEGWSHGPYAAFVQRFDKYAEAIREGQPNQSEMAKRARNGFLPSGAAGNSEEYGRGTDGEDVFGVMR